MDTRAVSLLAALLLAAGPLAGCLARGQDVTDDAVAPAGTVTDYAVSGDARDHLAAATDLARSSLAPDAVLVGAMATENVPVELEDPPFLYDTRADDALDGRALVWTYAFASGERTWYAAVRDSGEVVYAHELNSPYHAFGRTPLADSFLASASAVARVAERAEWREFGEAHPVSALRLALMADDRGAAWHVHRTTATGYALMARVDAATGDVTDVHRFPDDVRPCEVAVAHSDAMASSTPGGCGPYDPPQPPPPPPPEHAEREVTLDAFNREGVLDLPVTHGDFASKVVVTADVGGATPLDAARLTLYDPMGMRVAEATGTGALRVERETRGEAGWGGAFRAVLTSDVPSAAGRTVTLVGDVTYGEWLGNSWSVTEMGGGSVSVRQRADHALKVPEPADELRVLVQFYAQGPIPADATWTLLDPAGEALASGDAAGGDVAIGAPAVGVYTLRVTGGDSAVFGASYQYASSVRMAPMWM